MRTGGVCSGVTPAVISCLGGSSFPSSTLLCPHACGECASRLSPCRGTRVSWHHPHTAGQPVEVHPDGWCLHRAMSVGEREELPISHSDQLMAAVVRAMVLCWGCLALKPIVSHENKRPAVPTPHVPGVTWMFPPIPLRCCLHIPQQCHRAFCPSPPGTRRAQTAPVEQHEPSLEFSAAHRTCCAWRQFALRSESIQLTPSGFVTST